MPKVMVAVGDAAEAIDTLYPLFRLKEGGYDAIVAGPDKRVSTQPAWPQ